jgi:hypothetical protein
MDKSNVKIDDTIQKWKIDLQQFASVTRNENVKIILTKIIELDSDDCFVFKKLAEIMNTVMTSCHADGLKGNKLNLLYCQNYDNKTLDFRSSTCSSYHSNTNDIASD